MIPVDRGAGSQALADMTELREGRSRAQPPAHHLSGRNAPRAGRRAEIQVRRRASLCRDRRAVSAGGAQFRPVLAAPVVPALSRNDQGGDPRSDRARAWTSRRSSPACRATSRPRPRALSRGEARRRRQRADAVTSRNGRVRRFVRALQALRQLMQILRRGIRAIPVRRRSPAHNRGLAPDFPCALPDVMQLLIERKLAGILRMAAIDEIDQRRNPAVHRAPAESRCGWPRYKPSSPARVAEIGDRVGALCRRRPGRQCRGRRRRDRARARGPAAPAFRDARRNRRKANGAGRSAAPACRSR